MVSDRNATHFTTKTRELLLFLKVSSSTEKEIIYQEIDKDLQYAML